MRYWDDCYYEPEAEILIEPLFRRQPLVRSSGLFNDLMRIRVLVDFKIFLHTSSVNTTISRYIKFPMSKSFFFAIILLVVAASCKHTVNLPVIQTKLRPDSDGVVRDMTEEQKSGDRQSMQQKGDSSLGLKTLRNGFNGLQIRVWSGEGLTYRGRMFLIKHDGVSWTGELYYFRDSFGNRQYQGETLIEKTELKQSSREWEQLVKALFALGINTLPDYTQLPCNGLDTDEGGVMVEIAQNNFYKTYQFPTPSHRVNQCKEAKQVVHIVALIDKRFGNKLKDRTYDG